MKAKIFLIIAMAMVSPAHAAFDYWTTVASSATIGATCDSSAANPGVVYKCDCEPSTSTPTSKVCATYMSLPCYFSGTGAGGSTDYRVCSFKSLSSNPCSACSCKTSTGSWQTAGANVKRRLKVTASTSGSYSCSGSSSYEYGCAAGYYQTGASGGTITCSECPSLGTLKGTSAEGSTDITACYLPANKDGTDNTGTFQFTSNCYYTR